MVFFCPTDSLRRMFDSDRVAPRVDRLHHCRPRPSCASARGSTACGGGRAHGSNWSIFFVAPPRSRPLGLPLNCVFITGRPSHDGVPVGIIVSFAGLANGPDRSGSSAAHDLGPCNPGSLSNQPACSGWDSPGLITSSLMNGNPSARASLGSLLRRYSRPERNAHHLQRRSTSTCLFGRT